MTKQPSKNRPATNKPTHKPTNKQLHDAIPGKPGQRPLPRAQSLTFPDDVAKPQPTSASIKTHAPEIPSDTERQITERSPSARVDTRGQTVEEQTLATLREIRDTLATIREPIESGSLLRDKKAYRKLHNTIALAIGMGLLIWIIVYWLVSPFLDDTLLEGILRIPVRLVV